MIDIHTHILFDLDDGCKTIEDSLRTLRNAESVGVTDIICTPHCSTKRGFDFNKEKLIQNYNILQQKIKEENININIYLGSEVDDGRSMFDRLKNNSCVMLNDTKYILVDFGFSNTDIDEVLYELIVLGYKPIVAHPERYKDKELNQIKKWKKTGALIQLDVDSLFKGKQTVKFFKEIIKHQLADFIASDTHGQDDSYTNMKKAYDYVQKKSSLEYAEKLFIHNPLQIISRRTI